MAGQLGRSNCKLIFGIHINKRSFLLKFRCIASHFGEIKHVSPVITIDQIGASLVNCSVADYVFSKLLKLRFDTCTRITHAVFNLIFGLNLQH